MTRPFSDLIATTVTATLAGCLSALGLFWSAFCLLFGGPEGHIGAESALWGGISLGFAVAFAYASFVFYVSANRIASGSENTIYRYAYRAGPVLSALLIVLLCVLGGFNLLTVVAILVGIALLLRWVAYSREA